MASKRLRTADEELEEALRLCKTINDARQNKRPKAILTLPKKTQVKKMNTTPTLILDDDEEEVDFQEPDEIEFTEEEEEEEEEYDDETEEEEDDEWDEEQNALEDLEEEEIEQEEILKLNIHAEREEEAKIHSVLQCLMHRDYQKAGLLFEEYGLSSLSCGNRKFHFFERMMHHLNHSSMIECLTEHFSIPHLACCTKDGTPWDQLIIKRLDTEDEPTLQFFGYLLRDKDFGRVIFGMDGETIVSLLCRKRFFRLLLTLFQKKPIFKKQPVFRTSPLQKEDLIEFCEKNSIALPQEISELFS